MLVPTRRLTAASTGGELPGFRKKVFDRLSAAGLDDLEQDIVAETTLTPETFGARYNLSRGSAFGLAATLLQSGPFRPTIRSRRYRNLYHAGASSHPGGGVPMVTLSGRMVAEAIETDVATDGCTPSRGAARRARPAWSASAFLVRQRSCWRSLPWGMADPPAVLPALTFQDQEGTRSTSGRFAGAWS